MVQRTKGNRWLATVATVLIASLALSGCQFFSGGTVPEGTTSQDDGRTTQTREGRSTAGSGEDEADPAANTGSGATGETNSSDGSSNITVSPSEVAFDDVVLTFAVSTAEPMYDPARVAADQAEGETQGSPPTQKGYAVLGGLAMETTNNFDPTQSPPKDEPRAIVRHVALQVKDKDSGQLVPHVGVSIDLLREGRPVLQGQPLVPMVHPGEGAAQMHYGNNIQFPGKGEYQVFVRMDPSPLLGSAGAAQFNVSLK